MGDSSFDVQEFFQVTQEVSRNLFQRKIPRALESNAGYVLAANWSLSKHQEWHGYGYSSIYGPRGKILACAHDSTGSEIVYSTINCEKNNINSVDTEISKVYVAFTYHNRN